LITASNDYPKEIVLMASNEETDHILGFESSTDIKKLIKQAKEVLDKNWTGKFTKPTSGLYPHQWSWDSCFIAIGYAHYNQERAEKELRHLFSGQWNNGMVPQIVFNSDDEDTDYFPGTDFWQTSCSPNAPGEPDTSGICQPPVHATALLLLLENAKDAEKAERLARELFPKIKAWHDYLYRERDPLNEDLVYVRHPWESGQDNSPVWDQVLKRMDLEEQDKPDYERTDTKHVDTAVRPTDFSYDRYIYLVNYFRDRNYDENEIYRDGCPFLVQDILFNSLLCRANRDLARIAGWLGKDALPFHERALKTAKAVNNKLWDEEDGIYISYDLRADQHISGHSLAGFLPLYAHIPSPSRARRLFDYLDTGSFCELDESCFAIPTYDRRREEYTPKKYWRGPIWINLNWLLYHGLTNYGRQRYQHYIKQSIIYLINMSGFYEYYSPENGDGYGSKDFSWSAALFLDIIGLKRIELKDEM